MKLKNNALQELYDTLVNCTITISPYVDSPVDKAFRECDEKLSESVTFTEIKRLQSDNDILKRSNEALLGANLDLTSEKIRLRNHVEKLNKDNKDLEKRLMETTETIEKANADRNELQKHRDSYHDLYTELSKTYNKLSEENRKLNARTDCLRMEVEWYRKHYKEKSDELKATKERLDKANSDRTGLQEERDILVRNNGKKRAEIEELKNKLDEVTSQYQKITIENKRLQNNVRAGYDQGQTDLWVKLQNVNDSQPFELATCFPDVTGMEDILNWDLEDFLDAYKKWHEEKEKERLDHMRDYLARFCEGRDCEACPLESNEYKCGCGYSFKKSADRDMRIIPDEELERYYEKARGCGAYNLKDGKLFIHDLSHPMESINRGVTKACEQFCKAVRDADTKLKENNPLNAWECTLEGTINVEINKDLLEKVCGVKPDDEAHKLEYGDAVRVPWRDYDYMYIGPDKRGDGKMIRLFDPKHRSVAYVSSNEHLDIRGYKIIIGNEEDLRKIWCDKDADKEEES